MSDLRMMPVVARAMLIVDPSRPVAGQIHALGHDLIGPILDGDVLDGGARMGWLASVHALRLSALADAVAEIEEAARPPSRREGALTPAPAADALPLSQRMQLEAIRVARGLFLGGGLAAHRAAVVHHLAVHDYADAVAVLEAMPPPGKVRAALRRLLGAG